jgi:BirA family transcriptional regulator, biotin operon repressor / biotin---[acetyl-CoA-carboxylase] ligase
VPDPGRTSNGREPWRVRRFAEIDSTNRYLLGEARGGAAEGLVAVADHQTAGRGRFDRRWEAPPGSSLLVSVLLRPAPHRDASHTAVMAVALALAEAVEDVAGVIAELKWPNDLVVGDRKLAGLLAEREGDALVIGAGCNVEWEAFPPELAATSTACNLEAGRSVDRDALLDLFLARLASALDALEQVPARYRARLATLGRRVRVERAHDTLVGEAVDVTHDGALVVRDDDGTDELVTAGDVVHLRTPT